MIIAQLIMVPVILLALSRWLLCLMSYRGEDNCTLTECGGCPFPCDRNLKIENEN